MPGQSRRVGSPEGGEGGLVPAGFRFGVATAGFQIEGGYNGPHEPRNNWHRWESEGRVEPSGVALDFWNRYEEQLDRVAGIGCDSFRMSVEWARLYPSEGDLDENALAGYRAILTACRDRGLEPLVTLCHFTHPGWLGEDFWLSSDSPELFAAFAGEAVSRLGDLCSNWVTINELNILALDSYLLGAFPPGKRFDFKSFASALDHLTAAHVLAYGAIHDAQPEAVAAPNNFSFSVYELDRLLSDVICARSHGVARDELPAYLAQRRDEFYASPAGVGVPGPTGPTRRYPGLENLLRRLAASQLPLASALPRSVDAVYGSAYECTLDVAQIDYYDPETASHLQLPGGRTAGGRMLLPFRPLWDDPPNPDGLIAHARANVVPGLDLWVVENGLCNRVRRGRSYPRLDGWDRPRYLRANLAAVVRAVSDGLPVTGYWHWCLADNYEWGSYEPRFGLYGVDRERGVRWSDLDSMGQDAAGAYRSIIEGLRSGDAAVIGES